VTIRGLRTSRSDRVDLLSRPPCGPGTPAWETWIIDPTAQLETLADLRGRGLLSADEFERQKAKVIEPIALLP
jgi:hypothetical protein